MFAVENNHCHCGSASCLLTTPSCNTISDNQPAAAAVQAWLLAGVILILGSGNNWSIPIIASMVFTGVVIIVPALYEYLLTDQQKLKVDKQLAQFGAKLRGKKANNGFGSFSSIDSGDDLVHKDTNGAQKDYYGGVATPAAPPQAEAESARRRPGSSQAGAF